MAADLVALRDRREQVISRLSAGYADELFDIDELDRRLDLAHGARTVAELDALVIDLGGVTALAPTPATTALAARDPDRPASKRTRVIFGNIERRGRWTVPVTQQISVLFGNIELDLREASLTPGVTTLDVSITMGNLELVVPPHLAVEVDVSSFMSSVEERHRTPPDHDPARSVLRIVGAVRLGNLEIDTRLPGESSREAGKRVKREKKQLAAERQKQLAAKSED